MGGLIYGWAYIRNGESVSKLVGLYMRAYIRGGFIFGGSRYRRYRIYRGYDTVARKYEFYFRVIKSIFY